MGGPTVQSEGDVVLSRIADSRLRVAARVLTGTTYAVLGYEAARLPGARVELAGPVIAKIRKAVPFLPADDEVIVRANGAIQSAAGVLIAVGICQTVSALALVGSLIPTTLAGHSYWNIEDPAGRKAQRVQFQKNLAMLGGILYAALDGMASGVDS